MSRWSDIHLFINPVIFGEFVHSIVICWLINAIFFTSLNPTDIPVLIYALSSILFKKEYFLSCSLQQKSNTMFFTFALWWCVSSVSLCSVFGGFLQQKRERPLWRFAWMLVTLCFTTWQAPQWFQILFFFMAVYNVQMSRAFTLWFMCKTASCRLPWAVDIFSIDCRRYCSLSSPISIGLPLRVFCIWPYFAWAKNRLLVLLHTCT